MKEGMTGQEHPVILMSPFCKKSCDEVATPCRDWRTGCGVYRASAPCVFGSSFRRTPQKGAPE